MNDGTILPPLPLLRPKKKFRRVVLPLFVFVVAEIVVAVGIQRH